MSLTYTTYDLMTASLTVGLKMVQQFVARTTALELSLSAIDLVQTSTRFQQN